MSYLNIFSSRDDESFRRAWRKLYCSSSVKPVNTMNGKQGDTKVCDEFTRQFQSVFITNTAHSDDKYETELQELMRTNTNFDHNNNLKVDTDSLQHCLAKLKLNKSFDNISAEHLVYGGTALQIHLCLLFNAMLQHCYVPEGFGFSLIISLLKDKHGDMTQSNMYCIEAFRYHR